MLIDTYLPEFHFRERHECRVAASPAEVLAAALAADPQQDPLFRGAIALRELPGRLLAGAGAARAVGTPFGLDRFALLGTEEGREAVFGLAGQFWRLDYGLAPIPDGAAFLGWKAPGTARLALNFRADAAGPGIARLVTETRVHCADAAARRAFAPYWHLIRPVSGLIRRRMLAMIARAAEAA
ncbi:hypothetical protein [Mangrovicoccus sp. HB161399]|uniref:hypothetical protein n=1 Tax=Mangrovicoccus sp. HB161399 TaxID=2720392 RepID=UPI001554B09F|nr:hypothetical protein [Mangrovicoccus sp. HB161399]